LLILPLSMTWLRTDKTNKVNLSDLIGYFWGPVRGLDFF